MNALGRSPVADGGEARIAMLPMYDLPELRDANDALWSAICERLEGHGITPLPQDLARGRPLEAAWADRRLLLAQTCGYPLVTILRQRVKLVATPCYRAPGCDGAFHRSVVVVPVASQAAGLADLRGQVCAVNSHASNSGMNLLRVEIAPLADNGLFFSDVVVSGSHDASAQMVAGGAAAAAAIDCVTWAHLKRWRPALTERLKVLMWTVRSPGLPLITSADSDAGTVKAISSALDAVARDPRMADVRKTLLINGFEALPAAQYHALLHLEQLAVAQGYPVLN